MNYKKEIVKLLLENGFTTKDKERYTGSTSFGVLNIRPDNSSIFLRFETLDLEKFKQKFSTHNINEYSFKWNIHSVSEENAYWELQTRFDNLFN